MTKRETGFLLLGLGFGLLLALALILEVLLSLSRTGFVGTYSWNKVFLLAPVVLLVVGMILVLRRPKGQGTPN